MLRFETLLRSSNATMINHVVTLRDSRNNVEASVSLMSWHIPNESTFDGFDGAHIVGRLHYI